MMKGIIGIYALISVKYVQGFSDVFPRSLQLCGGGRGNDGGTTTPRDCSNLIGQGQCQSAADKTYDWCKNTVADAPECRKAAEGNAFAVGWEYYAESTTCYILFDNTLSESDVLRFCPSGYTTTNSVYTGTGFPSKIGTDNRYVCYSCQD
ncbi:hypothetical protein FisN_12Lh039 [Fistulifera solaris]|uniref:Uncharacterized protein n=1 Tax=Fistulifera solaris TaxID=1519565 RepID=A0A1Z5KGQ5_FISSO|nr:hypothetical protein FisN_12Lh039 [Fistulifera solaris]|eukprot:GAX25500.1 hypothetical protein FisN_12Lh039 [Fistulifera solaris]